MVETTLPEESINTVTATNEDKGSMTEKYKAFMEWCDKVGIVSGKLEFPAIFEGGLVGVRAKEPIKHREMIMSVPYKCLFSVDKARADPVLNRVFSENETLFGPGNPDADQLILTIFLLYEW